MCPMKSATKRFLGNPYSLDGSSTCSTLPWFITAMRCDSASASDLRMGDEHEGDAHFALQVDQLDLHFLTQLGIQRRQRFIEQQQARTVDQPARQRHALLLSAGKFVRIFVGLVGQAHLFQRFLQTLVAFPSGWQRDILSGKAMFSATVMCGNSA